jgi:hypothetical protein
MGTITYDGSTVWLSAIRYREWLERPVLAELATMPSLDRETLFVLLNAVGDTTAVQPTITQDGDSTRVAWGTVAVEVSNPTYRQLLNKGRGRRENLLYLLDFYY